MREVTLEEAAMVVEAARAKAVQLGVAVNIAVVDAGGNLTCFARMDGALLGSIDVALGKAYTSRAFDMPTADLTDLVQPGGPLYGLHTARPGVVTFAGGVPLRDGDRVVGAVGVSGGSVDQDAEIARVAAARF